MDFAFILKTGVARKNMTAGFSSGIFRAPKTQS
jgi:hypothetical protein